MQNPYPNITEAMLCSVLKPLQYLGGEHGSIIKNDGDLDLHVCLAFPDTYEVGMSHLGIQILYDIINRDPRCWAERVYVPQPDMEALLRKNSSCLVSLESRRPLHQFDLIGFSLQYELCATGVLSILQLGRIPLLASERSETDPLIIGGGPVACYPEPLAPFFDAFLLGDGEEAAPEIIRVLRECRASGTQRAATLRRLSAVSGVYVPALFEPRHDAAGRFCGMQPAAGAGPGVQRRRLEQLDGAPYPLKPVIADSRTIHDRLGVEIMRGCLRGCRFCQAGYLYRPQRERSVQDILALAETALAESGYDELSLLSLSSADFCNILPLLLELRTRYGHDGGVSISFPSTRVDALSDELVRQSLAAGRGNFTIAPEAGTQRLRDVINKGLTDEQILQSCRRLFEAGCEGVKLYFMIGLPTETDADLQGIVDLARAIRRIGGRRFDVTVSVSTFVPKPFTPFQWMEQISVDETFRRQNLIRAGLQKSGVTLRWHKPFTSMLEGVFARGDRRLNAVLLRAFELGCRLDGWDEFMRQDLWRQAFSDCGIEPAAYLATRSQDEVLPWEHLDVRVDKRFLLDELKKALECRLTADCRSGPCAACGACVKQIRNVVFDPLPAGPGVPVAGASPSAPAPYNAAVQRLRLKYRKSGRSRFIAHLDLSNIFARAARRARIPLAFSQGFNPHPRISFGPPLQLGLESECEYAEMFLLQPVPASELLERMNAVLPAGLQVMEVSEVPLSARSIQDSIRSQTYRAGLPGGCSFPADLRARVAGWRDLRGQRSRKGQTTTIALSECLLGAEFQGEALLFTISFVTGRAGLKPQEVLEALFGPQASGMEVKKTSLELRGD